MAHTCNQYQLLRSLRQEDFEFKACLGYIVHSKSACVTQCETPPPFSLLLYFMYVCMYVCNFTRQSQFPFPPLLNFSKIKWVMNIAQW